MGGYTVVNLMELEEGVSARRPEIEGRFGRSSLGSEHVGVSHFRYAPNFHPSGGHRHREQEEVYVILSGTGRVKLDDDVLELRPLGRGSGRAGRRPRDRSRSRRDRVPRDRERPSRGRRRRAGRRLLARELNGAPEAERASGLRRFP